MTKGGKYRVLRRRLRWLLRWLEFRRQFSKFRSASKVSGRSLPVRWVDRFPCLTDATASTPFDRHYVYHLAWAARVLVERAPEHHVDIGSSLHLIAQISAIIPITFVDIRLPLLDLDGVQVRGGKLTALPFPDRSVRSISCLHVLEHVGLGRYGEPLDPDGDSKGAQELNRVLASDGELLLVVPVGRPRVCFNAHRVYGYDEVMSWFANLELQEFALIPERAEDGGLLRNAEPVLVARQNYGCGCFRFRRRDG